MCFNIIMAQGRKEDVFVKAYSKKCYPEFTFWVDGSFSMSFEDRHETA